MLPRSAVLGVACAIHQGGLRKGVACCYDSLPPAAQLKEIRRLVAGDADVLVATEASAPLLSVDHVVFAETEKFASGALRHLTTRQVANVAGRASVGTWTLHLGDEFTADDDLVLFKRTAPRKNRLRLAFGRPSLSRCPHTPLERGVHLELCGRSSRFDGLSRSERTRVSRDTHV